MSKEYGSATINAVNNVRNTLPFQEPIGATNDTVPDTLANGTIGGGFAATDTKPNFELETVGSSDQVKPSLYVMADVDVGAGVTVATVASGHITAATGGTYTVVKAVKAGEYCWVHET